MALATLDWLVLALYVALLVAIGWRLRKGQRDARDYFLAGRNAPSWAVALSILATQAGAVSLIGAPAFVALHPEGGLRWLQYELALPVAMMFLLVTLVPFFHRRGSITVYEYLERRFDRRTRTVVSVAFQVSRALATGVAIYALAIVLSVALQWPLAPTIIAIGVVTLAYDMMGGMRAVLATDVIQMGLIAVGLAIALAQLLALGGGWDALTANVDAARLDTLDMGASGLGDGRDFAFWPMLLGGFFLYVSYYGIDQSQVQRLMSAGSERAARRALVINGVLRFPLVLAYTMLGLLLAGFVATTPEFAARIPEGRIDYLVPTFLVHHLPAGVTGLLLAAILAAAMSSLDSAINALSAATMEDLVKPRRPGLSGARYLRAARFATLGWGVACTAFALGAASMSAGVLTAINQVGSLFYGPLLAVFVLGALARRAGALAAVVGLAAGLATNLGLWLFAPGVSWLWWNVFGLAAALAVGALWRLAAPTARAPEALTWRAAAGGLRLPGRFGRGWLLLSLFFAAMLAATAVLPSLLRP